MFNLIKKDMRLTFSSKITFLVPLLVLPVISFLLDSFNEHFIVIYSVLTIVFLMTVTPFSYDAKDKTNLLVQSLPVTRREIVVSKYIGTFINIIIGFIFTIIYIFILSSLGFVSFSVISPDVFLMATALGITTSSILLPTNLLFAPKLANFISFVIFAVSLNLFAFNDGIVLSFLNLFSDFKLGVSIGIAVLYILSMLVSSIIYKNKKFY